MKKIDDPDTRAIVENNAKHRQEAVDKIRKAVEAGKIIAALVGGDPMIYGAAFYLEMLPKDFPSEIVPGVRAFQAVSAAVKMSPVFGYDTDSVRPCIFYRLCGPMNSSGSVFGPFRSIPSGNERIEYYYIT
jgi:precorrin-2 methylase